MSWKSDPDSSNLTFLNRNRSGEIVMTVLAGILALLSCAATAIVLGIFAVVVHEQGFNQPTVVLSLIGIGGILFSGMLIQYFRRQVRRRCGFVERIDITDTAVSYVYDDMNRSTKWSEQLQRYSGILVRKQMVNLLGPPTGDPNSLRSVPRSGTELGPLGPHGVRWAVVLKHANPDRTVILWNTTGENSDQIVGVRAKMYSDQYSLPILPEERSWA